MANFGKGFDDKRTFSSKVSFEAPCLGLVTCDGISRSASGRTGFWRSFQLTPQDCELRAARKAYAPIYADNTDLYERVQDEVRILSYSQKGEDAYVPGPEYPRSI
jgi:hypothetical protein